MFRSGLAELAALEQEVNDGFFTFCTQFTQAYLLLAVVWLVDSGYLWSRSPTLMLAWQLVRRSVLAVFQTGCSLPNSVSAKFMQQLVDLVLASSCSSCCYLYVTAFFTCFFHCSFSGMGGTYQQDIWQLISVDESVDVDKPTTGVVTVHGHLPDCH